MADSFIDCHRYLAIFYGKVCELKTLTGGKGNSKSVVSIFDCTINEQQMWKICLHDDITRLKYMLKFFTRFYLLMFQKLFTFPISPYLNAIEMKCS